MNLIKFVIMESPNRKSAQKVLQKNLIKESTKPLEFRLHTQQRATQRAIFNSSVAIKLCIIEQYKKQVEKVLKEIEEEEVQMLRRKMIPKAQLMPLFDRPFLPQRSTRPLTVPRKAKSIQTSCNTAAAFHTDKYFNVRQEYHGN